jgi:hypothetical protein
MVSYNQPTGYRPYFYDSGGYLFKPVQGSGTLSRLYSQPSGGYDFSSFSKGFYRPQTVEQVIQKGYLAVPQSEPETAILTDKKQTSWQGLDDIIRQVRWRYDIYNDNIYQIEQGKCYAISAKYEIEAHRGGIPSDSKEVYSVTKQLRELYEQQRKERVLLWQDISRLRQQLPESAAEYLAAYRKVSILEDDRGDLF